MSVIKPKRGECKLEVLTKARELAVYTIKITSNENVFLKEYQEAITSDLVKCAKDIFIHSFEANNVNLNTDPEIRRKLMDQAIRDCYNLLALMQIAKPVFHLSTKRIRYWGNLTVEVRDLIRKWKKSDINRLANKL